MDVNIRRAVEEDIVPVIKLSKGAIRKAYGDFIPIDALQPWLVEGGESDRYIIRSIPSMLVAVVDGRIVGVVVVEEDLVDALVVDVGYWSSGVGTGLLNRAEELLGESGVATGHLECFERNVRTVEFYKRRGWKIRSAEMDPDTGVRKVLMEKTL